MMSSHLAGGAKKREECLSAVLLLGVSVLWVRACDLISRPPYHCSADKSK